MRRVKVAIAVFITYIVLAVGISMLSSSRGHSQGVGVGGTLNVKVTNTPLPVSGSVDSTVTGTVSAAQSGDWKVGIDGTPLVNAQQSGDWKVKVSNLPAVQDVRAEECRIHPVEIMAYGDWMDGWVKGSYRVPGNAYLVIDDVDAEGYGAPSSAYAGEVYRKDEEGSYVGMSHDFYFTQPDNDWQPAEKHEQVRWYAGPGEVVWVEEVPQQSNPYAWGRVIVSAHLVYF